jgi:hypothetical protein
MFIYFKLKELVKKSPFFYIAWRIRTSFQNRKLRKISSEFGYDITKDVKALHRRKSKDAVNYAHSSPTIFDCLAISPFDKILDYGSGKGGAMIWLAQRYPFEKITGIEFCTEYDNVAKQNIAKSKLSHLITYNVDAATFTDIDEYNFFYLYNPFTGETMNKVVANIKDSYLRNKRKIVVVYANPRCREAFIVHREIFPYRKFCLTSRMVDKKNPYHYGFTDVYCTELLNVDFEKYGFFVEI